LAVLTRGKPSAVPVPLDEGVLSEARAMVRKAGMGDFVRVGSAPASEGVERLVEIR
jgi:hypothetical protein